MPHATLKLVPGVDTTKTPTLNELSISRTNLIRFSPDRSGLGLVQKLGGWTEFINGSFDAPIRAIKAWSDLEYTKYLALGGEGNIGAKVYNYDEGSTVDVTPYFLTENEESSFTNTGTALSAITAYTAVQLATTANLTATYSNGSSGVGATLTNSGTQARLSVDGVNVTNGDRILVKNQTTGLQNGVYTVTVQGTASTNWVLTRATDFDTSAEIINGATFFVQGGNVNTNRYYYCSNSSAVTVGTTSITFVRGGGITTTAGGSSITFYTTEVPSAASYVFFPTGVTVGNVNITGPYDILTTGNGLVTFNVPEMLTSISKIKSVTAGSNRTVTITFSQVHSFYAGQRIYVDGVDDSSFDGTFTISATPGDITPYTIQYTQTGITTATTSDGGTVNACINFGGVPPEFTTTSGSSTVQVNLVNHGLQVGDTFNVPISTTVGGVTLRGLYTVTEVNSPSIGNFSSVFKITADKSATSNATAYESGGNIYAYYFVSLIPSSQGANYFYGGGIYNEGLYSSGYVPSPNQGEAIVSPDWNFDNWGSILVASPQNGALYYWQPVGSNITNLSYMPNSPVYNTGFFVAMPQRQVVAYGSSFGTIQDPLLVRWCDLEDFTVWQAQAINQAGSYRLSTGSRIVGGIQASQQGLIWTDIDLWSMTYIGQPYIYSFNKIGANSGLIAQKAVGQMGGVVYWMGQKQFFRFAGSGVEVIPCPVWDQIFQNLYEGNDDNGNPYINRIRCATNSQFNEVTWYFPAKYLTTIDPESGLELQDAVAGNGEVNAYVKYNVALGQWDYGYQDPTDANVLVGRTAWIDQSVLGPPIGMATTASVNVNNGIEIRGYFTAESVYASGSSGLEIIYFSPVDQTFAVGTIVNVSGLTDDRFNGQFTVSESAVGSFSAVSVTSASPGVVTWTEHNLSANQPVYFTSTQSMPVGLSANTIYFVRTVLSEDTFTVSATIGGSEINTSSTGSGVIKCYNPSNIVVANDEFASTSATDTSAGEIVYDTNAVAYQHETSNNAATHAMKCGFTTGYAAIADGDRMTFIDQVWPDMKWGQFGQEKDATVAITFYVANYPGDIPVTYGPYDVTQDTQYLSVRMRGRLVAISVSSEDNDSFWRLGGIRYRFQEDGKY